MKKSFILILFALLAFGQTTWAQGYDYIAADGTPHNTYTDGIDNVLVLDNIIAAAPNADKTIGYAGMDNWFVVQGSDVVLNAQLGYNGHLNLILCDGAKLTVNKNDGNAIQCIDGTGTTLTIYVQSQGTGQLVATATSSNNYNMYKAIQTENLTIYGGVISATGGTHGIYASSNIVINGGTVTANGNDWGIQGDVVTINGGNVTANGGIWSSGMTSTLTVGYTNSSDRIYSTKYKSGYTGNTMMVKDGQYMITTDSNFIIYGYVNDDWKEAIAGHTLMPYTPTEWSGSGDSASDPYIIASVDDLNLLSLRTNGGSNDYNGKYFKLGANITFTHSTDWDDDTSIENNFTAIGGFRGHFDGNGDTISGLRIYSNDNFHEQKGLFSNLGSNAYIENLTISNSRIADQSQVGCIAGYVSNSATVSNCHVTGTVAVHAKGHTLEYHGGVVGINYGTITNCISEATISRSEYYAYGSKEVGGIVGANYGTLSGNKVFNADITAVENCGAIAGLNVENGSLTNNYYNACTVNGVDNVTNMGVNGADVATNDGAIAVFTISVPDGVTASATATFTHNMVNYYKDGVTVTLSGGLDDTPTPGWQKAYYINGVALQENSTTVSYTFDMPAEDVTITIGEIHADWATSGAQGTEQDPYLIYFTDQLDLLATRVNNGTTYDGKYFKLMDDLTYSYNGLGSTESNYTPIGSGDLHAFHGHFDGNNKSVSGIRIRKTGTGTDACFLGLFGSTDRAEVKDVTIKDTQIVGHRYLGGVVGHSWSSMVSGCHVWYNVSIILANNDSNTAGGIVGYNRIYQTSTVTNCISEVHIYTNGDSDCFNIGGIVGLNGSVVSNNFVMSAYIDGGSHFGAIVGQITEANALSNNYYRNCVVNNVTSNVGCDGADVTDNDGAVGVYTITINAQDVILSSSNEPTVTYQGTDYWKSGQNITLEGGLNGTPAPGYQIAYFINGEAVTENTFVMPANDVTVTVGECHADWETANAGTEDDPYLIYFTDQLDLLATRVNAGIAHGYADKYFKLMNDLTYSYEGLGATESNYTPIGGSFNHFYGHFDGNNKTISGIRIYKGGTEQDVDDFQGLFGYMDSWISEHGLGDVKNLTLDDAVITGHCYVGGIMGKLNGGTVDNCHVTSSVIIHAVVNDTYAHGGIAGAIINPQSVVSHCTSSATLTVGPEAGNCRDYGGIVGYSSWLGTLTDNFAIGATIPEAMGNYHNGAITGEFSNTTLERNYYYGCKVESANVTPSGVGCGGYNVDPYDITENDGAVPVFTLSLASGISADVDTTLTHNEVNYYKLGTSVSLSYVTPAAPGYRHIYSVNGWPIEGNIFYMDEDAEVTVAPNQLIDFEEHQGSEDDPYLIYFKEQWDLLAERVNGINAAPKTYSGKFFKLMEDISITTMVGANTTDKYFAGTFDGNGHKLTVSYNNTTDQHTAAFRNVIGATIKNLHVDGTIETSTYGPGGIVANNYGVTLINCRSSVSITSSRSDAAAGGLIAYTKGSVPTIIEGCVFDGTLTATGSANNFGGFMGWVNCNDGATVSITNSLYNPVSTNVTSGCMTFVRASEANLNNNINITNCYYTQTLGTAQGEKVYSIIPAEPVTVQLLGLPEEYDVSGITIYATGDKGLKFDDVFHAASGNVLDLNLGVTVPFTVANYLANGEVITSDNTGNNYILTMPDEDVTITATFSDVAWDGEGTEESPYLIYYNVQWDLLATNVNAGNNYNGVYFKLMDDISVETMVGSTNRAFRGIFDGGGHTLTFNKGTEASPYDQNFCAPFKAVEAATIKNLHTTGAIYTSKQHAAGFVAQLIPNTGNFTRFIGCRSSMKINSTVASDARTGGFIGSCSDAFPSFTQVPERLSIFFEDCLFDGEFSGTATGWGGFVGYYFHCESEGGNSGMVDFTRCLFAPSAMNISTTDAYNFVRSDVFGWDEVSGEWHHANNSYPEDVMTITKLYYTITCGNLENYLDEVQPTPVGNMTNVQLRNALGDNWMIVTEEAVEKVVPTMGNVVILEIAGYANSDNPNGGYLLLASPVGTVNPTHVAHMLDNAYDLYAFDEGEDKEWRNYKANAFNLEPGQGYLYANSEDVTLIFPGVPYTGDGEVTLSRTDNTSADFQGWNLVGNPFNETAYIADDRSFYTMNSDGSEITPALDNSIAPMEGVFVIAGDDGETMTFTTEEPNNGKAMLALNLSQGRGVIDRAIVRFGEGGMLPKFQIRDNSTKVYIQQDNKDYAVVNAERAGEMPVNFKAKENGSYMLSLSSEEVAFSYLHIIDNMTGNDVDMLQTPNYTFNAKTTDYASRFKLVFATKDGPSTDSETFAFYSNGSWVISNEGEATLQVIDVNGRILSSETVNGSVSKAIHAAPGVYVIRLINGDDVKTQKIVVR